MNRIGVKEHGCLLSCAAQLCEHGPAVPAGKHYIEDEQIIFRVLGQMETVVTIPREIRDIAVFR
jgi:hypothetical protein